MEDALYLDSFFFCFGSDNLKAARCMADLKNIVFQLRKRECLTDAAFEMILHDKLLTLLHFFLDGEIAA